MMYDELPSFTLPARYKPWACVATLIDKFIDGRTTDPESIILQKIGLSMYGLNDMELLNLDDLRKMEPSDAVDEAKEALALEILERLYQKTKDDE